MISTFVNESDLPFAYSVESILAVTKF